MVSGALLALICGMPAAAEAQTSRAEAIGMEQAEKARYLRPHEPTTAERVSIKIHEVLTELRSGFYPNVGSVYSGGGLALGPGYRHFYALLGACQATPDR